MEKKDYYLCAECGGSFFDGCTLLETIYEIVNNKKELLDTRDLFLSTYKK